MISVQVVVSAYLLKVWTLNAIRFGESPSRLLSLVETLFDLLVQVKDAEA